jgi:DNA-binding transcriptional LysR family regulator
VSTSSFVPPQFDNRISLQKLEIVSLVVELGSVARAAEHLAVPQPVVMSHLRSLEERFRVTLFTRSVRTLQLTEEGQRVYDFAARTLADGRVMIRDLVSLEDGDRGSALVGASMSLGSYLLPPILITFRRSHPQAELTLTSGDAGGALRGIQQGDLDFAIVMLDRPPDDPAFVSELLVEEELVLVTAPDGRPEGDEIRLSEFHDVPMLTAPRGSSRRALMDRVMGRFGLVPQSLALELGHPQAIKRAVINGFGASVLSRMAVERELEDGIMREVRMMDGPLTMPIYAIRRADKRLSELQQQLLDAIRSELVRRALPEPGGGAVDRASADVASAVVDEQPAAHI